MQTLLIILITGIPLLICLLGLAAVVLFLIALCGGLYLHSWLFFCGWGVGALVSGLIALCLTRLTIMAD